MSAYQKCQVEDIQIEPSRDALFTEFGKAILKDRYLVENETFQGLFARVSSYYSDNPAHGQRLYNYMSQHWFMPATPILSNGGTERGMPISCFINEAEDSLEGIINLWNENVWLAAKGGGIGSYWGHLREMGSLVKGSGESTGPIPFMIVQNSLTHAISQGSLRRGSAAIYMPIWHPEIEEFIDIRKPTGGDPNRKALNIHHGVVINDAFMEAVEKGVMWDLVSPKDQRVIRSIPARDIWIKLLVARIETGEPYILFIDTVNKHIPEHHKKLGLYVKTSNLCSEITLPTGRDHLGKERTAVCCLSSLNLETYDEWKDEEQFIEDIMRFLDNVLQDFIDRAPDTMARAKYSAMRERSVGLGVMGFHSYLQSKGIPVESVMAKVWNKKIFPYIKQKADEASILLAHEKGPCPDAAEVGVMERFSNKLSIAPTASISIIAGTTSPSIEPLRANSFTQKTLTGSFTVRNRQLEKVLIEKNQNTDEIWSSIATREGSVQHLSFLSEEEKLVFKTAIEIDQRWLVDLAADRTPYICQAQSLNLFMPGDIHKKDLHTIHFEGWKKGVKSFYYARSTSIQRADAVSHAIEEQSSHHGEESQAPNMEYNAPDECLACQ